MSPTSGVNNANAVSAHSQMPIEEAVKKVANDFVGNKMLESMQKSLAQLTSQTKKQ